MQKRLSSFLFLCLQFLFGNNVIAQQFQQNSIALKVNIAPALSATGNQTYCSGGSTKIVTGMTIVDPDDTGIDAIYIQISSGYSIGEDLLTLVGTHPNITSAWNSTTGTLSLTGVLRQPTYIELIAAIKDIEFSSYAINPTGIRNFSITVGQANYLPTNGHYYLYVPNIGITWTAAEIAAQASTYYGLQGYLATITSSEEAQIAGEQTVGAGWIGGSDSETEGIWKWVTGPEAGTFFWNGDSTGFTTNYAFWNTGEPNNTLDEDYAHVTAPGVGIAGSWNDLSNTGSDSGDYQPKGYVVEYGGMPGDPILYISTSTTLLIPSIIIPLATYTSCEFESIALNASASNGVVNWYANPTGGLPLASGNQFITPNLSNTTTYYLDATQAGCLTATRVPLTVNIIQKPILTVTPPNPFCGTSSGILTALTTAGIVNWFLTSTDTTPIAIGNNFTTPIISNNTTYYVEANNNNCFSPREPISVVVNPKPILPSDANITICEVDSVNLDAGIVAPTYLWSTGETTRYITVNLQGQYNVLVTTLGNCSATRIFDVTVNSAPAISAIITNETTAIIQTTNPGDFEYSINGIDYQNSNTFTVFEGGNYIGHVREKNGCGVDQKPFIVISVPNFFSPNGDNINDTWSIKGALNFSAAEVVIFDRFGKLIAILNTANPFWDGTFNGKPLPSSDYWFVAKINTTLPERKGHFCLIR